MTNYEKIKAMRGAANSYKMHYEKAKEELDKIGEEHKYLKKELDKHDLFYFCSIGGCEGASNTCWKDCANSMYNVIRVEAVKEFVERLKKSDDFYDCIRAIGNVDKIDCLIDIIDNLVKEMVGED